MFRNKDTSVALIETISVFPSAARADTYFGAMRNPKLDPCLTAVANIGSVKSQISGGGPKGDTIGTLTVTAIDPANWGANIAGFTLTTPITRQGASWSYKSTEVFFTKGRLFGDVVFDGAFPTTLSRHLTSVAEKRLHS
jgi:hypothetical protein